MEVSNKSWMNYNYWRASGLLFFFFYLYLIPDTVNLCNLDLSLQPAYLTSFKSNSLPYFIFLFCRFWLFQIEFRFIGMIIIKNSSAAACNKPIWLSVSKIILKCMKKTRNVFKQSIKQHLSYKSVHFFYVLQMIDKLIIRHHECECKTIWH